MQILKMGKLFEEQTKNVKIHTPQLTLNTSDVRFNVFKPNCIYRENINVKTHLCRAAKKGYIIFSRLLPFTHSWGIVPQNTNWKWAFSTDFVILKANSQLIINTYLFYFLTIKLNKFINNIGTGYNSTFPRIPVFILKNKDVILPNKKHQLAILKIINAKFI